VEPTTESVERELFGIFNAKGGRLTVRVIGSERPLDLGLVDSFRVVRVAAHEGGDGMDFWLLWRALGWQNDPQPQFSHLKKVLRWEKRRNDLLLHTEDGDEITVDFLDHEEAPEWAEGQRFKTVPGLRETWLEVDRRQTEHMRDIANHYWHG
jgi:hypothetical protein